MHEGWKTWALYALGIFLVGSVLVGTCVYEGLKSLDWNPPPNAEALRREKIVDRLQPSIHSALLRFVYGGSDPGKRAGDGDFQLGDEVHSYRTYAFTGDRGAACAVVVNRLLATGWAYQRFADDRCEIAEPDNELVYVRLSRDCGQFRADASVQGWIDDDEDAPRRIEVEIETYYPTGVTNGTLPDAGLSPACR